MGNVPLILVIDELPNLMVILCGSALSFMEKKVLSEKSPLFGRRTSQIKLEAFLIGACDVEICVLNWMAENKESTALSGSARIHDLNNKRV